MFAAHVATHVYRQGFAHGADPRRARAHTVDPSTDVHWRRGFHAGRAAAGAAERAFFTGMLRGHAAQRWTAQLGRTALCEGCVIPSVISRSTKVRLRECPMPGRGGHTLPRLPKGGAPVVQGSPTPRP
jgi:hypothetical protein